MKKIKIISVGSLSPDFKKLFLHYQKQISHYYQINTVEVKEFSEEKNIEVKKTKETKLILDLIPKDSFVMMCSLQGKQFDSVDFSDIINSHDDITFIIGGSDGMDETLINSNIKFSFSKLTFPHQLFRIMLGEQIYRAASILNNKKYHK
ncbi:23S rRNA (pseudouridine(1915)-N(3))-methyltransferase RlmH [Mycoplasma zalophidermidis]|uniref:Ribosomal RNA large subunit methyltransferase H n=1 Tax=Mycoplasma zalophidermidis TaxID=398174 RepID=A0ABS6DRN1_9MOLU|nr:23S rRNA (pseudouridine(1915)-N(3))-methyltransferase RlmH [Mycoplasma zalophidermidis]MBU4689626.1 23S rRNA (pseudouridine(1915)-N(3))-methyltransferase RlmH [Mycoplasma zalophidermidis]MBU4693524.1 23S rRNA (pseudouridine(1915)-N(3))-methyltransferase RlmH [Mycoplasma zalophidermidis]MCR8966516.1 23S rRNA (pseudouridine(1915)-N(3))-methyltransferase RlmH [Mycoplasma zalophidermidis]